MKLKLAVCCLFFIFVLNACSSVFSGGTGGLVVDAESTSTPKAGIANVDVYAYMSSGERDSDFNSWLEGTKFTPAADYYGHTTTASDGSFLISKLVWQTNPMESKFGKDADYTKVYLLFYHENFGLTKGETVVISDSSTDTVYAELTSVRKSTVLNLNFEDVTTGRNTAEPVYVQISVPQTTAANTTASPKVYEGTFTGAGSIAVTYPRESAPEVTITYVQSADQITWAGCYNGDNAEKNYAFRADAATGIKKVIKNPSYNITFYGKATKLAVPAISGQYFDTDTSADDGLVVSMKQKDGSGAYSIDLGQVTTAAQAVGTNGKEKHGMFNGLGAGYTWTDTAYTAKFATTDVEIYVNGTAKKQMTLRSDSSGYNVQLQR